MIFKKYSFKMIVSLIFLLITSSVFSQVILKQAESMTLGGPYAGITATPFDGVAYYGNGDYSETTVTFTTIPGEYLVSLTGASSNGQPAGINLEVDGVNVGSFGFTSTTSEVKEKLITFSGTSSTKVIKLILSTDNGSNDTYIDQISFEYIGTPAEPRDAPVIPELGSVESGVYRNMFVEAGYDSTDVQNKMESIWQQIFYGDDQNERLYYPVNDNEAYILDVASNDVRSEGMSYGMMICVQLDHQEEFDRLWRWASNYSQHQTGARKGYFAWQCSKTGEKLDPNPASDGEEYFVTALLFASERWGNSGTYDYEALANEILIDMQNKEDGTIQESVTNMFNETEKQITFVPFASSALFTDPSYHLPSFYEVWKSMAGEKNDFWGEVAEESRGFFLETAHPVTGLMPDYAEFDGAPNNTGNHGDFRFDSWRNIMNMAMDYAWYKTSSNEYDIIKKQMKFFHGEGVSSYGNQYTINGTSLSSDHSPGLVATNAVGALASDTVIAWDFIDEFYSTEIPSGQYRYYDGLLYMMAYMHLSGNFKAYIDNTITNLQAVVDSEKSIVVYPVPTSGILNIDNDHNETWHILDFSGRTIMSSNQKKVDISHLKSGIYLVKSGTTIQRIEVIKK